jgi:hypothetical protein
MRLHLLPSQPPASLLHGLDKVHRAGWQANPIRQFSAKKQSRKVWIFFRKCGLLDLEGTDDERLRPARHELFE